jgi:hypothetical protein
MKRRRCHYCKRPSKDYIEIAVALGRIKERRFVCTPCKDDGKIRGRYEQVTNG